MVSESVLGQSTSANVDLIDSNPLSVPELSVNYLTPFLRRAGTLLSIARAL